MMAAEGQIEIGEEPPGEFVVLIEAYGIRGKMKIAARFDERPDSNRLEYIRAQVTGLFRRVYVDWPSEKLAARCVDQTENPTTFRA
jgi:hypothetical protein